jgi:hypothetical protein
VASPNHGGLDKPMKCVKSTTNEIRRIPDDRAAELITKGWAYAPKSAWKGSEGTTWVKASVEANPMSASKVRRKELKETSGRKSY